MIEGFVDEAMAYRRSVCGLVGLKEEERVDQVTWVRMFSYCYQTETVSSILVSPMTSELALIQMIPCCLTKQIKSLLRRTLYVEGSSMHSALA